MSMFNSDLDTYKLYEKYKLYKHFLLQQLNALDSLCLLIVSIGPGEDRSATKDCA